MPGGRVVTAGTLLRRTSRFFVLSRLDRLSKLSGHIALVVSTILASAEAWKHVNQRPETAATNKGSGLELEYDPVREMVEYRFRVVLRNDGLRDDVLEGLSAALETSDGGQPLQLGDVTVTGEGDAGLPLPIPVGSRGLNLSTSSGFNPQVLGVLSGVGERHLVVRLRTESNSHTLWFCFDVPDSLASRLFGSGTRQTQPFRAAACQPTKGAVRT